MVFMIHTIGMLALIITLVITTRGCDLFWREGYTEIESVEVQVSKERPASVQVHIVGLMGDPTCGAKLLSPYQERKGNIIRITVRAWEQAGVICYAAAVPFEITVPIKERFELGTYRVIVNSRANSLEKGFEVPPK
jgi:hypothetical protein